MNNARQTEAHSRTPNKKAGEVNASAARQADRHVHGAATVTQLNAQAIPEMIEDILSSIDLPEAKRSWQNARSVPPPISEDKGFLLINRRSKKLCRWPTQHKILK